MMKPLLCLSASLMALALVGCNPNKDPAKSGAQAASVPGNQTLSGTLASASSLSDFNAIVRNAGLDQVLNGVGPYTVLAPTNSAFGTGEGQALAADDMRGPAAALVRAQVVPGVLTRADILAAIDASRSKRVQIRNMADGLLTLTRDGSDIIVITESDTRARLVEAETLASNGAIQPVDGVLVAMPTAAPAAAAGG